MKEMLIFCLAILHNLLNRLTVGKFVTQFRKELQIAISEYITFKQEVNKVFLF